VAAEDAEISTSDLFDEIVQGMPSLDSLRKKQASLNEVVGAGAMVMGDIGNLLSIFGVEVDSTIGKITRLISSFDSLLGSLSNITGMLSGGGGGGLGLGSLLGGLFGGGGGENIPGSASFVGPLLPEMGEAGTAAGTSFLGGFGSTLSKGFSGLGKTLAPIFTNPLTAGILAGVAGLVFGLKALFKEASAETTAEFLNIDFSGLSANLQDTIQQMGEQIGDFATAIQLNIGAIFAEGGFTVDQFAEKIGDTFSAMEQGLLDSGQAQQLLNETVAQLLPHLDELGADGVAQLERILAASDNMGVSFEGQGEIVQALLKHYEELGQKVPPWIQEIADGLGAMGDPISSSLQDIQGQFDLTNQQAKELADLLGVEVLTETQKLAKELGVTPKKLKEIGAAIESKYGIPLEGIQALLETMGVSIEDLAAAFGIDVAGGVKEAKDATTDLGEELETTATKATTGFGDMTTELAEALGVASDFAGTLEKIPRSIDIEINEHVRRSSGGKDDIPGMQHGGWVGANPPWGSLFRLGEKEPELVIPKSAIEGHSPVQMSSKPSVIENHITVVLDGHVMRRFVKKTVNDGRATGRIN
jgi:transcriptional regulator with XRE-family HTH domain